MIIGKIEKNVSIPEVHSKIKYPWPDMKAGDSVFFKAEKGESVQALKRKIGPAARYYGEKTGKTFRTLIDREVEEGVRVWRTK